MASTSSAASSVVYSAAVAQYSLNRVDRGRLSSCLVDWSEGSTRVVGGAAGGSVTDALEVNDFPELSDVLSLPIATFGRCGERSRVTGSRFVGAAGGCSSSRGLVRSLALGSVSSVPETGDKGRFWDWTSVSMPGESWTRSSVSEDGRGRVAGDTEGGIKPDTTFANDRGLAGGVMDISSLWVGSGSVVDGGTGTSSLGPLSFDGVGGLLGHFFASWPVRPHLKHDLT